MKKKIKLENITVTSFVTGKEKDILGGGYTDYTVCTYCPGSNSCVCSQRTCAAGCSGGETAVNCGSANPC